MTAPKVPAVRRYSDPQAMATYDEDDAHRARLDAAQPEWIGAKVKILSSQGTGRVAGRGVVEGFVSTDIVQVRKANGKLLGMNTAWLVREGA